MQGLPNDDTPSSSSCCCSDAYDGDPWHGPSLAAALARVTTDTRRRARRSPGRHTIQEIVRHLTRVDEGSGAAPRRPARRRAAPKATGRRSRATTDEAWQARSTRSRDAHRSLVARVARQPDATWSRARGRRARPGRRHRRQLRCDDRRPGHPPRVSRGPDRACWCRVALRPLLARSVHGYRPTGLEARRAPRRSVFGVAHGRFSPCGCALATPRSPQMDARAAFGIGLGLAQHLARDRRDVALAEGEELQQVDDRVAFGPAEVGVRHLAGAVADVRAAGRRWRSAPRGCRSAARGTGRPRRRATSSTSVKSDASLVAHFEEQHRLPRLAAGACRAPRAACPRTPATSPTPGRLAMIADLPGRRGLIDEQRRRFVRHHAAGCAARSSAARARPATSAMIVTMKNDAIRMPSGRSMMLVMVV